MFTSIGRFAYRRRTAVLLASLVFAIAAAVWGSGALSAMAAAGYEDPNTEAERTNAVIEERFGDRETVHAAAVYVDESQTLSVDDPEFADAVTTALDGLPQAHISSVTSYWSGDLPDEERELLVAEDGHATFAMLTLTGQTEEERLASYRAVLDDLEAEGLELYMGGQFTSLHELDEIAGQDLVLAQAIALPLLFVLLVVIFRGLVAAAVPVLLALLSVLGSLAILRVLTTVTEVSVFALQISLLLGLGLAIDYGLFVVGRFRDELSRTGEVAPALTRTVSTAGRTVAFSGLTVAVALCGLLFFPVSVSRSIALGGITVVLFTVAAALLALPAALAVLGTRINALAVPGTRYRAEGGGTGFWARTAGAVMRRPVLGLLGPVAVLLVAAVPLMALNPGTVNHRYLPSDSDGQISSQMIQEEFPDGGPADASVEVVVLGDVDGPALDQYVQNLGALDGPTAVALEDTAEGAAHIVVSHTGDPDDEDNLQLVRELRAADPPEGAEEVLVGGAGGAAATLDSTEATLDSLPTVLSVTVAGILVLLFFAFRSVLLPIKALLMSFVSLSAAFGILTWAIQEGGLASALGFTPVGTTDIWLYGIVFVIALGLMTDYELFIVSRAREAYLATGDNTHAVRAALQRTGGIITSAAALMAVVMGTTGVISDSLVITTLGIGLTIAILLDATIVRGLLVPATMRLFGSLNWWVPTALRAVLDRTSGEQLHRPGGRDPDPGADGAAESPAADTAGPPTAVLRSE